MGPAALESAPNPFAPAEAVPGGWPSGAAPPAQGACPAAGVDSGTDADTASSFGEEIAPDGPDLRDKPMEQRGAHLVWVYERPKARW
eukprot:3848415-Pyramimonas_sp.AAC.1